MISSIIQHLFAKTQPNMSEQEKKRQKSMISLTPKPSQKTSKIIAVSLWPPPSPNRNPLDYTI